MYKKFGLQINEDIVDFEIMELDETTKLPKNEDTLSIYNNFLNTEKILDISELAYIPERGSIWNGTNFILNDKIAILQDDTNLIFYKFVLLDRNNVVLINMPFKKDIKFMTPHSEMLIAAFSSNAKIIDLGNFEN